MSRGDQRQAGKSTHGAEDVNDLAGRIRAAGSMSFCLVNCLDETSIELDGWTWVAANPSSARHDHQRSRAFLANIAESEDERGGKKLNGDVRGSHWRTCMVL